METVYFLVPLAVSLALLVVGALVWAVRSGQFDDLDGASQRILMDDEADVPPSEVDRNRTERTGDGTLPPT